MPVRWGGYHRPVCVETVVGPLDYYSVEGWDRQQQQQCSEIFNRFGPKMHWVEDAELSGPKARVFLQLLIPLVTWSVVNVTAEVNDFRLISLDTKLVSRLEM